MTPKRWSVLAGSLVIAVIGGWLLRPTPEPKPVEPTPAPTVRPEAVAALGSWSPPGTSAIWRLPMLGWRGHPGWQPSM